VGLSKLLSTVAGGPPLKVTRGVVSPRVVLPVSEEDDEDEPIVVTGKARRLLVPFLDEQIQETNKRESKDREGAFHVSEMYYLCPRQWILQHYFPENKKEPHSADTLRLFKTGHIQHSAVQDEWLGPAGVLKGKWICKQCEHLHEGFMPKACDGCDAPQNELSFKEPGVGHKGLNVKGHCDGVVVPGRFEGNMDEWALEAKTMKPDKFALLVAPLPAHLHQINVYMHLLGMTRGIFLYFCKSTGEVKEYTCDYDPAYWRDVESKIGAIRRFLRKVRDNGGKADPSWVWQTRGLCYSETSRWALWCHQSEPCMDLKGYRKGSPCGTASAVAAKSLTVRGKPLTVVTK